MFATTDKRSQIVFFAGDHIMGERFEHEAGPIHLRVAFHTSSTETVDAVEIFHGEVGAERVTRIGRSATLDVTPGSGEHFYYARITQSDGAMLWSAPIWITRR